MKKLNKLINILLVAVLFMAQIPFVNAASATINLTGANTATNGGNYELTIAVANISGATGGVASFEGKLVFDEEYLEYSSSQSLSTLGVSYATKSKKMAGVPSSDEDRITASSFNAIKFVFKVKKSGTTTINLIDPLVGSGAGVEIPSTVNSKTITISEPVPKSTNAYLKSFGVTGYDTTPAFNKDTLDYKVTVPNSVSSVTITAAVEDSKASVNRTTLNATNLIAGSDNKYSFTVTAEDGTTKKTYTMTVFREKAPEVPKSTDNDLKSLGISGFTMSPSFDKDTTEYSVTVPNDSEKVIVNATANDGKATVKINGGDNLQVGDNKVEVVVTAEDGSTKVYNINIKREEKHEEPVVELDKDATLSKLSVSGQTLSPEFKKDNNVYSLTVGESVTSLNIDAIANSDKAKVSITGNTGLKHGMNTVTVTVTAENGDKNSYIINVYRKDPAGTPVVNKSGDSYLSSLVVNGASISPNFNRDVSSYTVTVPYDMEKLDISYVTSNSKAKVEIIGNDELQVGTNNIQVKVTAEDGSVRIYTINATRTAFSAKNNLKTLTASGFTLNPGFDKDRLEYNVRVKHNTDSLDLTAIPEFENSKVEITGNSNFKTGNNVVLIKVTDEHGFTKYYQINVEKPAFSILGMSLGQFLMFLLLGLGLVGILFLLLVLLKRRNEKKQVVQPQPTPPAPTPVIDFKPEFNFGSRNGTDDDVVYPGGVLNQGNGQIPNTEPKKLMEADYEDLTDEDIEEVTRSFDFFDQTITKDELIAAIREGMETKNTDKLRMLLKQDELNQLKKEIKRKEMAKKQNRSGGRYDNF